VSVLQAEGTFLGLGACLQDYDLTICTNYQDILDSAKEPPRGTLKNWFAPYVLVIMGMVYNTKEAKKPGSYQDLLIRNTGGGSAFPPMAGSAIPGCRC
jgi:spermidine/putrescine-binding protein